MNVNTFFTTKNSPWPMMLTMNSSSLTLNLIFSWSLTPSLTLTLSLALILTTSILWNLNSTQLMMKLGMTNMNSIYSNKSLILIFIISELFFFSSFFYINFSIKLFNNINQNFNMPLQMFKLNTIMSWLNLIILLTSSLTFMTAINQMNNHSNNFIKLMMITITLSFYFTLIQLLEYTFMQWNSTNSLFMSNFYLLTLFHMTHVLLGTTLMIIFSLYKMKLMNIKPYLTLTCWYWHFIDLIWLIIVMLIY